MVRVTEPDAVCDSSEASTSRASEQTWISESISTVLSWCSEQQSALSSNPRAAALCLLCLESVLDNLPASLMNDSSARQLLQLLLAYVKVPGLPSLAALRCLQLAVSHKLVGAGLLLNDMDQVHSGVEFGCCQEIPCRLQV